MNWIDLVIVAVFTIVVAIEVRRGFGKALFDFAALLVAVRAVYVLTDPAMQSPISLSKTTLNPALLFAGLFVVLGIVLLFVGKFLYDTTLVSADHFDSALGGLCGVAVGITICHAAMRAVDIASGAHGLPPVVASSLFGTQLLDFQWYNHVIQVLSNLDRPSDGTV